MIAFAIADVIPLTLVRSASDAVLTFVFTAVALRSGSRSAGLPEKRRLGRLRSLPQPALGDLYGKPGSVDAAGRGVSRVTYQPARLPPRTDLGSRRTQVAARVMRGALT